MKILFYSFFCLLSTGIPQLAIGQQLLPTTDNTAPPYFAVYRWPLSNKSDNHAAYGKWLNRTMTWAEDFMPTDSWENIEGGAWQMKPTSKWITEHPGRRLILSVPLLPGDWKGNGPKTGTGVGVPVSLEEGATGAYNSHFQKLAENLVQYGLGESILRLGWEFNGGWYTWRANTPDKARAYAGYWKEIVKTMRAVPGAENLKFCWNPALLYFSYDPALAWPGDEYVDYIGLDVYDESWVKDTYPLPDDASSDQLEMRYKRVWDEKIMNPKQFGFPYWKKFASDHGNKPLSFPEWGVSAREDKHGGKDNAYFVDQMYRFIHDPQNNVYFHCYFDVQAKDGHHQLSPTAGVEIEFPKSTAKFKELWSMPSTTEK